MSSKSARSNHTVVLIVGCFHNIFTMQHLLRIEIPLFYMVSYVLQAYLQLSIQKCNLGRGFCFQYHFPWLISLLVSCLLLHLVMAVFHIITPTFICQPDLLTLFAIIQRNCLQQIHQFTYFINLPIIKSITFPVSTKQSAIKHSLFITRVYKRDKYFSLSSSHSYGLT